MKVLSISITLMLLGLFNNANADLSNNVRTLPANNSYYTPVKQNIQTSSYYPVQTVNTSNVTKNNTDNISREALIAQINHFTSVGKYKEKEELMDILFSSMKPGEIVYLNEYSWVSKLTDEEVKKIQEEKKKYEQEKKVQYESENKNLSNIKKILNSPSINEELLKVADDNFENLFMFVDKSNISTKSINFSTVVNKYKDLKDSLNSGNNTLNEIFLATYALANCSKAKKMGLEYVFAYNEEQKVWEHYIVAKNNPQLKNFKYDFGIFYNQYEFVLNREVFKTNA